MVKLVSKKVQTVELSQLKCNRCEWEWFPRALALPKICPKCKSPYWNKARTRRRKGAA